MAVVTEYKFENVESVDYQTKKFTKLQFEDDYALVKAADNEVVYDNLTAPTDAREKITFFRRDHEKVDTGLDINYKSNAKACTYGVKVEDTLVTTGGTTSTMASDETRLEDPVIVTISIKHPKDGVITDAAINTALWRAISAFYFGVDASGSSGSLEDRFNELLRGQLVARGEWATI